MREIKFKGKRVDNGEWVCGDLHHETVTGSIYVDGVPVFPETVGQYVGCKDKNGVDIYESDIVAFEDSDGGYEYQDVVIITGIVEYGELGFYFTNRVAVEMDDFYIKDCRCDDVEVIGSVHDNPELMEEKECLK